jgi:hypothetical protein
VAVDCYGLLWNYVAVHDAMDIYRWLYKLDIASEISLNKSQIAIKIRIKFQVKLHT